MTHSKIYAASVLFLILALTSLLTGVAEVSLSSLFNADEKAIEVYLISRVPRLIAIILAGAALSVAGLIMQQILQNRFASPSTTGTIDSAILGYLLSLILLQGASLWMQLGIIFTITVLGTLIFINLLQRLKFKNAILVPLIGIMYGNLISAFSTFIAYKYDLVQAMSSWTTANFASVLQGSYEMLFLALPSCLIAYYFAHLFSAASMGERFAKNIGLDYQRIIFIGVMLVAISTASVVMIVGVIPFLGLIVPNVVSLFMGDNMRKILPWTAYWGVILVLFCDILGRVIIFPYEVPISMIISIFGGGVFIYLILRDKKYA